MSYHEVIVQIFDFTKLAEIHSWIHAQGWKEMVEWRWFKLDILGRYKFQFDDPKHAEWFALRWA